MFMPAFWKNRSQKVNQSKSLVSQTVHDSVIPVLTMTWILNFWHVTLYWMSWGPPKLGLVRGWLMVFTYGLRFENSSVEFVVATSWVSDYAQLHAFQSANLGLKFNIKELLNRAKGKYIISLEVVIYFHTWKYDWLIKKEDRVLK